MNFESAFRNMWTRKKDPSPSSSTDPLPAPDPVASSSTSSSAQPPPAPTTSNHPNNMLFTQSLPHPSRLPISAEPNHPLRKLHELFSTSPYSKRGWTSATPHATVLRQIFFSIWPQQLDFLPYYELDLDALGRKMPLSKDIVDWINPDEQGFEQPWTLSGYQNRVRPEVEFRPGRSCGKVLQRMTRTYSCK